MTSSGRMGMRTGSCFHARAKTQRTPTHEPAAYICAYCIEYAAVRATAMVETRRYFKTSPSRTGTAIDRTKGCIASHGRSTTCYAGKSKRGIESMTTTEKRRNGETTTLLSSLSTNRLLGLVLLVIVVRSTADQSCAAYRTTILTPWAWTSTWRQAPSWP